MIDASIRGRLGRDPEQRTTRKDTVFVTASIAVSVSRPDQDDDTVWINISAFGKTTDILMRHQSGDLVNIMGRLTRQKWQDRDGNQRENWQLTAEQLVSARTTRPSTKRRNGVARRATQQNLPSGMPEALPRDGGDMPDDEIPF